MLYQLRTKYQHLLRRSLLLALGCFVFCLLICVFPTALSSLNSTTLTSEHSCCPDNQKSSQASADASCHAQSSCSISEKSWFDGVGFVKLLQLYAAVILLLLPLLLLIQAINRIPLDRLRPPQLPRIPLRHQFCVYLN